MQGQQQSGDNSLDFLWTIGLLIGLAVAIWYFGKSYISTAILYVRLGEASFVKFIFSNLVKLFNVPLFNQHAASLTKLVLYIQRNLHTNLDFKVLLEISNTVGDYFKYPISGLIVLAAGWLHFGGSMRQFQHVYTTKTFRFLEKKNWPQITPVVNFDLVSQKIGEGPWAMALSPMNYCKNNNLIDVEQKSSGTTARLRYGEAYRILAMQLGSKWKGVDFLPIYLRALFAIFAARINEDRKGAETMLDQISSSAITIDVTKMNFHGVEELLRKHMNSQKVTKIIARHGYVTTIFASLLVGAREIGVLASSEFIWLKPLDRRMWYMLNSVGRPTAVAEICGAFAHWLAEKRLGMPLMAPMVEEAVKGLEIALSEVIYKPDEEK